MHKILLISFTLLFSTALAQTETENQVTISFQDSISGGNLDIHLDQKLEQILKSKEKSVCKKSVYVPPKKLSAADRCATQQKIMGYKIQIFYTRDRDAANKVKNDFAKKHPGYTPELIYAAPDYRILVGDYFTRSSSGSDLRRIQKTYPGAFPVQWRVWCRKAH